MWKIHKLNHWSGKFGCFYVVNSFPKSYATYEKHNQFSPRGYAAGKKFILKLCSNKCN